MPLSVLTDDQVGALLDGLTLEELESFRSTLKAALHEYSVGTQSRSPEDDKQPERQSIYNEATGTTTLFMPSRSPAGMAVKVITLTPPTRDHLKQHQTQAENEADDAAPRPDVVRPTGAITLFSASGTPLAILHATQLTAFRTALASLCLVQRRDTVKTLTVFGAGLQAYYHIRLALMARGATIRHVNVVSHRFSDTCRLLLKRFYSVPAVTKRREGWADCQFGVLTPGYVDYPRLLKEQVRAADVIFCCTPSTTELFPAGHLTSNEGRRKGRLVVAIGSYTPEMHELPVELLRQATRRHEGGHAHFHKHALEGGVVVVDTLDGALKEAGEILAAGLRPNQLVELGELVMLHQFHAQDELQQQQQEGESEYGAAASPSAADFERLEITPGSSSMSSVFSSNASTLSGGGGPGSGGGTTASSSRGSSPSRRSIAFARDRHPNHAASPTATAPKRTASVGSAAEARRKKKDDHLALWLQTGNVIYKSVGLGLMDLSVGLHLVEFAMEKGVGTHVEGF